MSAPSPSALGLHRVIGQPGVLPQPAERLDPDMPCQDTELEIAVDCLHVDASSLRQLRAAHGGDLAAVRTAILELVRRAASSITRPLTRAGCSRAWCVPWRGFPPAAPDRGPDRVAGQPDIDSAPAR